MPHPRTIIPLPRTLSGLVVIYGTLTLAAQVILLREFLALARGNELQLGVGLWAWLFWVGLGSLLGGRLGRRGTRSPTTLGWLLLGLGWILPLTLLATRAAPLALALPPGQDLPAALILGLLLGLAAPLALLSGLFFPLASRELEAVPGTGGAVGRAYALETLGAAAGGAGIQLLLWGRAASLTMALGLGMLAAAAVYGAGRRLDHRRLCFAAGASLGLGAVLLLVCPSLDLRTRHWQTPNLRLLAVEETPYQVVAATRQDAQVSIFANNLWYFSFPDPLTAENQVHFALLQHPDPRRVLLLGGGAAGLVLEILKTPALTHLVVVELDPQIIPFSRRVLPVEASRAWMDPRVQLVHHDARRFVQTHRECYDVVLLALPEPKNALLNRFYTREFFQEVSSRLLPGGVFSLTLRGAETSLSPTRARYLALACNTLQDVFDRVVVFPGLHARFCAGSPGTGLTLDPALLQDRLQARGLRLLYFHDYYFSDLLAPGRLAYLQSLLEAQPREVNTDLRPQCYYYGLLLSAGMEGSFLKNLLLGLRELPGGVAPGLIVGLALAGCLWARRSRRAPLLASIVVMGLSTMVLEIVLIILFQIEFGCIYSRMALLLAAFMLGLAAGSALVRRLRPDAARAGRLALGVQAGLALFCGLLSLGLPWFSGRSLAGLPGGGEVLFAGLLFGAGLLGGALFAAQAEVWSHQGQAAAAVAGRLYAADLLGATLGTFGASLVAVPLWGLPYTLGLVALLNLGALAVLAVARRI